MFSTVLYHGLQDQEDGGVPGSYWKQELRGSRTPWLLSLALSVRGFTLLLSHSLPTPSSGLHAQSCLTVAALHSREGDANWTSLGQGSTFDPGTLARMSGSQSIKMTSSQPLRVGRRFRGGRGGGGLGDAQAPQQVSAR